MGGTGVTIFSEIVSKWEADTWVLVLDASRRRTARFVVGQFEFLKGHSFSRAVIVAKSIAALQFAEKLGVSYQGIASAIP
jgi:hypothetical protein